MVKRHTTSKDEMVSTKSCSGTILLSKTSYNVKRQKIKDIDKAAEYGRVVKRYFEDHLEAVKATQGGIDWED